MTGVQLVPAEEVSFLDHTVLSLRVGMKLSLHSLVGLNQNVHSADIAVLPSFLLHGKLMFGLI